MREKSPTTKSWRDVLPIHPAAELFPRLSPDELKALGADIKQNGLHQPPAITTSKKLLDGISRLDAMEAAGVSFEFSLGPDWALIVVGERKNKRSHALTIVPDKDAEAYVISANIQRRHLTAEQKDKLLADLIKAQPTKSNRQLAKTVGMSHPHVAKVREKLQQAGDVETVTTSIDTKGRKQPAKKKRGVKKRRSNEPAAVTAEVQAARDAAAARIRGLMGPAAKPAPARDDIGPTSTAELERQDVDNDEPAPLTVEQHIKGLVVLLQDEPQEAINQALGRLHLNLKKAWAARRKAGIPHREATEIERGLDQAGRDLTGSLSKPAKDDPGPMPASLRREVAS